MKAGLFTVAMAALLASCASTPSEPKSSVEASVTDVACSKIEYKEAVTSQFPEVAKACRSVIRNSAGTPFVKVNAKVKNVRRNLRDRSVNRVTLDMLDANGNSLHPLTMRPPRNFRYMVDGEEKTADYMARGQDLRIYLPTDRWEVIWDIETATPLDTRVYVEDMETYLVTSDMQADEAFEFDSAALSANGKAELDAMMSAVGEYVPSITIFGHTDSIGDENYNMGLSARRAEAARDYLVTLGVPADRITAVGRGETMPVVTCDGMAGDELKTCLAPNRRAEVVFVVPAVADFAALEVTKTYEKPLGERVTVTERLGVAQLAETSKAAGDFLESCSAEVDHYCDRSEAGGGRILGCLAANKQAGHEFSANCDAALVSVIDAVLFRRSRMNAVGSACSTEIAACDAAPVGTKLECVAARPKSENCATAMSMLAGAAF